MLDAHVIDEIIQAEPDNSGIDLIKMSYDAPVMLVFLRHFGCTFCREALADLSKHRETIEALEVQIVFVHMVDRETAALHLGQYELDDCTHVCDPTRRLYDHFGLRPGNFRQLFGLNVMMRGLRAGMIEGMGHGFKFIGDPDQMPGLFMLQNGGLTRKFIHEFASDRPDYVEFAQLALARLD